MVAKCRAFFFQIYTISQLISVVQQGIANLRLKFNCVSESLTPKFSRNRPYEKSDSCIGLMGTEFNESFSILGLRLVDIHENIGSVKICSETKPHSFLSIANVKVNE